VSPAWARSGSLELSHRRSYVLRSSSSTLDGISAYTHSWTFLSAEEAGAESLQLHIHDPFASPSTAGAVLPVRVALHIRTSTTYRQYRMTQPVDADPAPLRVAQAGGVWALLFAWPVSVARTRIPQDGIAALPAVAAVEIERRAGEVIVWLQDALTAGGRLIRAGQSWHVS
jgi:hypothetical protein